MLRVISIALLIAVDIGGVDTAVGDDSGVDKPFSEIESRKVDGVEVPPFGNTASASIRNGISQWPEPTKFPKASLPLAYTKWTAGHYKNAAGKRWFNQINQWYRDGTAAGLTQDKFRSFDNDHSSIKMYTYPQLTKAKSIPGFGASFKQSIFDPRVTMGVQSYGINGKAVIEDRSRTILKSFYTPKSTPTPFQAFFRQFYEYNFLFIAPAVNSYKNGADKFAFLSPFYLHSVGASGTDSNLMKPFLLASAALPPELKTRILRNGLFVPTLMYLFKSHIAGDIFSPEAHKPAYALPQETKTDIDTPSPFLDSLLNSAHNLTHIPPVSRLAVRSVSISAEDGLPYGREVFFETNTYGIVGALRQGQTIVLSLDLRFSWTDENLSVHSYSTSVLRGDADIEYLNDDKSVMNIRIPWRPTNNNSDQRTDIMFLVNDGTYYSAPAYLSIRHIHKLDPITQGIKVP